MTYRYKDRPVTRPNNWAFDFRDHLGRRQRISLRTSNKRAASRIADYIETVIACRASRLTLPMDLTEWLEHAPRLLKEKLVEIDLLDRGRFAGSEPLSEHLDNWRESIIRRGNTTKHADQQYKRAKAIIDGCQFKVWSDVEPARIQNCLASMKSKRGKKETELSNTTRNYFLKAFKSFCSWSVRNGYIDKSPAINLQTRKTTKIRRRALEIDEVVRLLEVTADQPPRYGLSGDERSLLYLLAIETGLRANELRSLKVSCFDLKGQCLRLSGEHTKNSSDAILPLRPSTVSMLRSYLADKSPNEPVFYVTDKTSNMIKEDLTAAGIDYTDTDRGKLDFHSLRHTFGTMLAASGVHPKTAQELMRHSKIDMTMDIYTHTLLGQTRKAIESLPDFTNQNQNDYRNSA